MNLVRLHLKKTGKALWVNPQWVTTVVQSSRDAECCFVMIHADQPLEENDIGAYEVKGTANEVARLLTRGSE